MTTYVPLSELRVGDVVRISREGTISEVNESGVRLSSGEWYGSAFNGLQAEVLRHDSVRSRILALPVGGIFALDSHLGVAPPRPRRTFLKIEENSVLELENKNTFILTPPGMFTSYDLDQFTVLYEGPEA